MRAYPKIEICSPDGRAMYVTIDGYVFYIDNSTNEQIMDCWKESRCVNCGYDLEQKVNGVIKYVIATEDSKFQKTSILDDGQER